MKDYGFSIHKTIVLLFIAALLQPYGMHAQRKVVTKRASKHKTVTITRLNPKSKTATPNTSRHKTILYGQASFYGSKFQGRRTANGEKFSHAKFTAACNSLPLGTWIKVTNLKNGKTVVVKTNDRLHPSTKRLIDLTKTAAQQLGFVKSGLTRVKVEVLSKKTT